MALRDEDGDVTPLWEKAHLKTQEWLCLAENKIEMQSKWFTVVQFDLNSNFKLDLNSVKRVDSSPSYGSTFTMSAQRKMLRS